MLNQSLYKKIFDQSTVGYAYHKIVTDKNGNPRDYIYLEVNQAFEEITGMDAKKILGKPVTKMLPGIEKSEFDWIGFFGEVALNGKQKSFTQYSEPLRRWYKGSAFSPEPGFFVVSVLDVTQEEMQIQGLKMISKTSESFLNDIGGEIPYQQIADTLLELSEGKFAAFNLYNEEGDKYKTAAIAGDRGSIGKAMKILGMKLDGKEWDHDPFRAEKIKDRTITRFSTLYDLTGEMIPKKFCDLLTKTFGIGETVLVKILKNNVMLGDFTIMMEKTMKFRNDALVETFGRQLGLMIDRGRMDEELKDTNDDQAILLEISRQLMSATSGTLDEIIEHTMGKAGEIAVADRVYVFEYDFEKQISNNTYEWCGEGISPQLHKLQGIPLEVVQDFLHAHKQNKTVIIDDIPSLSDENPIKSHLENQEIKSTISVPLFVGEDLYGYIGYDSVKFKHHYTTDEKSLLQQYGNSLLSTLSRIRSNRALQKSEKQNRFIVENISDMIWMMDLDFNITYCSDSVEKILGYSAQEFRKLDVSARYPDDTLQEIRDLIEEEIRMEKKNPDPNRSRELIIRHYNSVGETKRLAFHLSFTRDAKENPIGLIGVSRDITESVEQAERIEYLSFHDHLTGLFNRRYFEMELKRLDTKRNLPITMIMGDLNGLKLVNDSFGHGVGDELIVKAAEVMKRSCRADEIVARIGGDEYAILLPGVKGVEAEKLIDRIKETLKQENVEGIDVSLSLGYATKTSMKEETPLILKKAEDHMYSNKLFEGPSIRSRVIDKIISAINRKSPGEEGHAKRVSEICVTIGEALGMKEYEIKELRALGLLHDIGKIAISDEILNKPGVLTEEEFIEMGRHAEIGYRILRTTNDVYDLAEFVLAHHERWDGKGYPKGLAGEEIPLQSRICSIAEAYDVMTTNRLYRSPMTVEDAIKELENNAETQFDPNLVPIFVEIVSAEMLGNQ